MLAGQKRKIVEVGLQKINYNLSLFVARPSFVAAARRLLDYRIGAEVSNKEGVGSNMSIVSTRVCS